MKKAFTLSEILITLGIIGVVAAVTMPSLIAKYKEYVLKQQFKKSYSLLSSAVIKAQADLGYSPLCFYNIDGRGGDATDCVEFGNAILSNLKIIKTCTNNAYPACIPKYKGIDDIKRERDSSLSEEDVLAAIKGCAGWRKQSILYNNSAYVLSDGQILLSYASGFLSWYKFFAVDINGKRPPNKWGYDIFIFFLKTKDNGSVYLSGQNGSCNVVENGGMSSFTMINNVYK